LFLNIGHFLDHFMVLIFATVAALRLTNEWNMTYAELIPYATPAFIAFGLFAIPAGWLADKWSREGMMAIFFVGIGASSIYSSFASSPLEIGFSLTLIGMFGAIYHPVGLAMVVQGKEKMGMPLAINGIFGNIGVASAALVTGLLIDSSSWRSAFMIPGIVSIIIGMLYLAFESTGGKQESVEGAILGSEGEPVRVSKNTLIRVFGIIFFTTAVGGIIFQSTTFSLPRIFDERLSELAGSASLVGLYTFLVFTVAAFAQLIVGYLIDNHSIRSVFAWVAILQTLLFALMIQLTGLPALIVAFGFMFVVFGEIPIKDVLVGRMARSEWRSRAYGVTYIIGFTVSASALPMIAWLHGSWGFNALFVVLAILAFVIFIAVLFLPKTKDFSTLEYQPG
jgi:MFS family permease